MKRKDAVVCSYLLVLVCNNQKIATILRYGANNMGCNVSRSSVCCMCVLVYSLSFMYAHVCVSLYLALVYIFGVCFCLFVFVRVGSGGKNTCHNAR